MFKQLLSGELLVHPSQQSLVNLQISQFNPLKRDNTDGILDCLTYAPKVIELYPHLLLANDIIDLQESGTRRIWKETENACF